MSIDANMTVDKMGIFDSNGVALQMSNFEKDRTCCGSTLLHCLPETDLTGVIQVPNHIHDKVKNLRIRNKCPPIADYLTVSMDVATLVPMVCRISSDLVKHTDYLLYEAKKNRRNQTRSA